MDRIGNLGVMDGPLILFGGPYSNLHALKALLDKATQWGVPGPQMISTGDLVAYCAHGQACVDLIRANGIHVVAGNCEKQLATEADGCGCGFEEGSTCATLSKGWYPYALGTVSAQAKSWMGGLPDALRFRHFGKNYAVIHGGVSDISAFLWSTSEDARFRKELELLPDDIDAVFAGHSGIAFRRTIAGRDWINVGALGMPENDGDPRTSFAVLHNGDIRFERLDYDHQAASHAMILAGLTQGYETSLLSGFWPSEDVLPHDLRQSFQDISNSA